MPDKVAEAAHRAAPQPRRVPRSGSPAVLPCLLPCAGHPVGLAQGPPFFFLGVCVSVLQLRVLPLMLRAACGGTCSPAEGERLSGAGPLCVWGDHGALQCWLSAMAALPPLCRHGMGGKALVISPCVLNGGPLCSSWETKTWRPVFGHRSVCWGGGETGSYLTPRCCP